jgi:hypothetical protein
MTDMGTPLADFLTRAAVAASAPAAAAASSALVPCRWPFRRGSMPRQADDARSPPKEDVPATLDPDHQKKLDELRGLDGKEFDQAYDKAQLEGHEEAVDLFRKYAPLGDNKDLKQWPAQTLPHLQHHLSMTEKLK